MAWLGDRWGARPSIRADGATAGRTVLARLNCHGSAL